MSECVSSMTAHTHHHYYHYHHDIFLFIDGALTGLSKKMIKQRHGTEQFTKWRRGYDTPPPLISSFSHYCKLIYPTHHSQSIRQLFVFAIVLILYLHIST